MNQFHTIEEQKSIKDMPLTHEIFFNVSINYNVFHTYGVNYVFCIMINDSNHLKRVNRVGDDAVGIPE